MPYLISDPLDFTGDSAGASGECKSTETECVFPFRYKGTWHNGCTNAGRGDDGSRWCATRVDRRTKEMVDNFWGVCKMASCHLSKYEYNDDGDKSHLDDPL